MKNIPLFNNLFISFLNLFILTQNKCFLKFGFIHYRLIMPCLHQLYENQIKNTFDLECFFLLAPLTYFWLVLPFHTPWKYQKTNFYQFSGVFRGYKMRQLIRNGLKQLKYYLPVNLSITKKKIIKLSRNFWLVILMNRVIPEIYRWH